MGQRADLAIGRPLRLAMDLGEAYFFDPVDGRAIAAVASRPPMAAAAASCQGAHPCSRDH